ncbi:MAG: hypothetical protein GVY24_00995 [Planctomycetes bacterium]|jgi:Holliday junction DNA helicase RuvA|nr:hypothetical protein [Planctomycetota bacterium]
MIARIQGTLDSVRHDRAHLTTPGGLTYEILLPAFVALRLADQEGKPLSLHTFHFLESTAQGATMFPRLAGFLAPGDRAFYELFVTVKGIGHRRALRAMALPPAQIAAAIADRDVKLLQTLPEIGRRTAETITVTLKDKVEAFISAAAYPAPGSDAAITADDSGSAALTSGGSLAREALEVLLQLGESRLDAVQLIDRVLAQDDPPADAQGVVTEVYRLKAGG